MRVLFKYWAGLLIAVCPYFLYAEEQCPADLSPSLSTAILPPPPEAPDTIAASCFVSWNSIGDDVRSLRIVDVRKPADYSSAHVVGSINLPIRHLKTKSFLKDSPLLILDYGISRDRLLKLCTELRAEQFSRPMTLVGGLGAAIRKGMPINGKVSPRELIQVFPKQVLQEYYNNSVRLVVWERDVSQALSRAKIDHEHLDEIPAGSSLTAAIVDIQVDSAAAGGRAVPVVLVESQGATGRAESLIVNGKLDNVFYLEGGKKALLRYLEDTEWSNITKNNPSARYQCPNA